MTTLRTQIFFQQRKKIVVEAYGTLVTGPSMVSDGVHIPSTEENFEKLTLLGALSNHLFLYNFLQYAEECCMACFMFSSSKLSSSSSLALAL